MNLAQTPRLYTVAEVAEYLNVGRSLVYVLIGRGTIRSIKVGRMRRIPESALVDFVNSQLKEQGAT